MGITTDGEHLTGGNLVNLAFVAGLRGLFAAVGALPLRHILLHAVHVVISAEFAVLPVEGVGKVYPVADGQLRIAVSILQLVVAGHICTAEGEAAHAAVFLDVAPNPTPVGLGPAVLLVGDGEQLRFASSEFVNLEPEGHGEGLRARHAEVCALHTEALFGQVDALRTCTVGLATSIGEGDFLVRLHLDVGLFAVSGERIDFGQCAHAFAGNLDKAAEAALGFGAGSACGVVFCALHHEVVTTQVGQAFHGNRVARLLEHLVAHHVVECPGGRFVHGIYEGHLEGFAGLDDVLVALHVVIIYIGTCLHIVAPSDFGVALHIQADSGHAEAYFLRSILELEGYAVEHTCPGGGQAHKHGFLAFLLCVEFEEGGVDVDVVARFTSGLVVGHVEDNLAIHAEAAIGQHLCLGDLRLGRSSGCAAHDGAFAQKKVGSRCVGEVEGNHGQGLAGQVAVNGEGALHPGILVGQLAFAAKLEGVLVDGCAFLAFGCQHEAEVGRTAAQLIAQGDDVAHLKGILGLEEVEVFAVGRTEDAQTRTAHVCIVPHEFGIHTRGGHIGCRASEELVGKPPAPCRQVVLHAHVVPAVVVLTHALPVEELTITQVEVADKRFFAQVPTQRGTRTHEGGHAVEAEVVGVVLVGNDDVGAGRGVAATARKPALGAQHIGVLLDGGVATLFAAAFPEHILAVCAPEADGDGVVLEQGPVVGGGLVALHIHACVEVERVASQFVCLGDGVCQQRGAVPVIIEEEACGHVVLIAESLLVVVAQTLVEGYHAVVVRTVVPEVLEYGIGIVALHLLDQGYVVGNQRLLNLKTIGELRVVAEAVHTVVVEELGHLVSTCVGDGKEVVLPVARLNQVAIGYAGH